MCFNVFGRAWATPDLQKTISGFGFGIRVALGFGAAPNNGRGPQRVLVRIRLVVRRGCGAASVGPGRLCGGGVVAASAAFASPPASLS